MAVRTLVEALETAAGTDRGFRHLQPDGSIRDQPYAQLLGDACRVAASLCARRLAHGALVGIAAADAEPFLTAFMGVSAAGLVPVPLQAPAAVAAPDAYARTLEPTLRVSRARVLLVQDSIADRLQAAGRRVALLRVSDAVASDPIDPRHPRIDDVALVQFTSGSTADPRGVVLTHRAIAANAAAIGGPSGLAFSDADRGVSWLPLYHDMGLVGMALSAMYFARPTTFLPPLTFLKRPIAWLRTIARERGTVSFAPNFAYELCVRRIRTGEIAGLDLSSWRVAGCGGEPIRPSTLEAFARKFACAGFDASSFTPCYGLAEHTLAVTLSPRGRGLRTDAAPGEPDAKRVVSSGVSCPGHRIRIVDEEGSPVPERHVGEIEAQGPSLMREYFEAPDRTRAALHDGWLRTGDLGYVAEAELYVCGRRKEMIVLNGRNYFPQDIEWVCGETPGIRPGRLVAFGIAGGEDQRERLVVLVEPSGGADRDEIASGIRRRVSDAFGLHVDEVAFAPPGTIEMTTSGKPRRSLARQAYACTGR